MAMVMKQSDKMRVLLAAIDHYVFCQHQSLKPDEIEVLNDFRSEAHPAIYAQVEIEKEQADRAAQQMNLTMAEVVTQVDEPLAQSTSEEEPTNAEPPAVQGSGS